MLKLTVCWLMLFKSSPPTTGPTHPQGVINVPENCEFLGRHQDLILASWREATEVAYSCNWRRWERWCSEHRHDQMSSPIRAILDFLAEQYHQGKQYKTINSYRSAISMTHLPIDGVVIGKHPLITLLMRGVYNTRPPQPKYSSAWDVGHVLGYIGSGGPNQNLTLKQLTHKLVTLFALANASRVSELEGVVLFKLTKLLQKTLPLAA